MACRHCAIPQISSGTRTGSLSFFATALANSVRWQGDLLMSDGARREANPANWDERVADRPFAYRAVLGRDPPRTSPLSQWVDWISRTRLVVLGWVGAPCRQWGQYPR